MDEFFANWVKPFYLKGLIKSDVGELRTALAEVTPPVVDRLLSSPGWREQIVGSWFSGLKGWSQFEDVIGVMLLASRVCEAGRGHSFALACFADEASRRHLVTYLDHYLRRPELFDDQHFAMPALMWIDEKSGTSDAARFLVCGGLWETFTAGKNDAWHLDTCKRRFWETMQYCQQNFGAT